MPKQLPNLLIAIYGHPESYPPTLNAIRELSSDYNLELVGRNIQISNWDYPKNCRLYFPTKYIDVRHFEKLSTLKKIIHFLKYTWLLLKRIYCTKPSCILMYDTIPTLSVWLLQWFISKNTILWYHNHDVADINAIKPYSIQGLAIKSEKSIFSKLHIFTLPTSLRLPYFDLGYFRGSTIILPNFPSKSKFKNIEYKPKLNTDKINLLYQGSIGRNHGIEEIINLLNEDFDGYKITLTLIGPCVEEFKAQLMSLADKNNVTDKLQIIPQVPYNELKSYTIQYDIGLAIHKNGHINFETAGFASNKIFEYIACGLPVILHDTKYYRENLAQYQWAFFTDLTKDSLSQVLRNIIETYEVISRSCIDDFNNSLNYETSFTKVQQLLKKQNEK